MRRLFASRFTSAALVGVVTLLAAGGGYALAHGASKSITLCAKKHGGSVYKAKKCKKGDSKLTFTKTGPQGKTGATGATGATGPGGPVGPTGGFVSLGEWAGGIDPIAANSATYVFAGPTTTVTTNGTQNISATGSAALGTSTGSASIALGICVEPSGGTGITLLNPTVGMAIQAVTVTTTRIPFAAAAAGTPTAGTWTVGICVEDQSHTQAIDSNDWSIGYAFVSSGALATSASESSGKAAGHRS